MKKVGRKKFSRAQKRRVFERDGYKCKMCSKNMSDIPQSANSHYFNKVIAAHRVIAHIVPLCDGGTNDFSNLELRCKRCEIKWTKNYDKEKAKMKVIPLELADISLVEVKTTNIKSCKPTPHCKKHGAMNKITKDGIWRCITVTGYTSVQDGNAKGQVHRENICRAGCNWTK